MKKKHTFYTVFPKDPMVTARWWCVDEHGLEYVTDHYTNYNKDPDNIVNRFGEYEVKEVKELYFDFGGMYRKGTPECLIDFDDVSFNVLVTQVSTLLDSLQYKPCWKEDRNLWRCRVWHHCWALGLDTVKELIPLVHNLNEQTKPIADKLEKEMDDDLADNKHLLRIKR